MATTNPITGDKIASKFNSEAYVSNWDRIFKKKDEPTEDEKPLDKEDQED